MSFDSFERLPAAAREVVRGLVSEPSFPEETLRHELTEFRDRIARCARQYEFVDRQTATDLADRCEHLLERVCSLDDRTALHLVQIAIRYLVLREDAEGDVDSIIGFDDDQLVVAIVEAEVARRSGGSNAASDVGGAK